MPGWLNRIDAATLHGVVLEKGAGRVLEMGSYLGRSTALLALAAGRVAATQALLTATTAQRDRQQLEALGLASLGGKS